MVHAVLSLLTPNPLQEVAPLQSKSKHSARASLSRGPMRLKEPPYSSTSLLWLC
jgi:hypothetical protein